MEILVTGLHRSGTSAIANLISLASGLDLLDDPWWAFKTRAMGLAYKLNGDYRAELESTSVLKCPRMAEHLGCFVADFPHVKVVFVFRDPRDVYCSIREKVNAGLPTGMLANERFGWYDEDWEGTSLAFNYYAMQALEMQLILDHKSLIFVQYESFYKQRDRTTEMICNALRIPHSRYRYENRLSEQFGPHSNKSACDQSIKGPGRYQIELDIAISKRIWDMSGYWYNLLLQQTFVV